MNTWQKIALAVLLLAAARAHAEDTVHYYYTDPQGTVLAKADAAGNIIASYDYAPYGSQAMGTSPSAGPTGYTGHVNDPDTGLVYMQARYYDPAVGRFLSTDPVGFAAGNVFTFNRFAYVNNNPIVNDDPTGRAMCSAVGSGGCEKIKEQKKARDKAERGSIEAQAPGSAAFMTLGGGYAASGASSQAPMTRSARAADAILTLINGTAMNEMKRPNHPTKIPDKLAHELFMVNAAGVSLAASPGVIVVGGSAAPVVADGAVAAGGVSLRIGAQFGGRAVMAGCLAAACRGEEQPYQFAEQKQLLQEMYTGVREAATDFYRVIIQSDPGK